MAIASVATEYVFTDFLLKDSSTEGKYKSARLDLALDKLVLCIAVGLPLLFISLAFAQEVSVGNLLTVLFLHTTGFHTCLFSWLTLLLAKTFAQNNPIIMCHSGFDHALRGKSERVYKYKLTFSYISVCVFIFVH